jgi:hypothetical protein
LKERGGETSLSDNQRFVTDRQLDASELRALTIDHIPHH